MLVGRDETNDDFDRDDKVSEMEDINAIGSYVQETGDGKMKQVGSLPYQRGRYASFQKKPGEENRVKDSGQRQWLRRGWDRESEEEWLGRRKI